jgi:hypothetical protein
MQLRAFEDVDTLAWEQWCSESHCASFLHHRAFLSYHGSRFIDRSVLLLDGERWLGVLPAAQHPTHAEWVESHPGITYGGFVHNGALRGEAAIEALQLTAEHYAQLGYQGLRYKPLPHIYHQAPAQDDLYALFRLGAQRVRCDLSACIDLAHPLAVSERRRRGLLKAQRAELTYAHGPEQAAPLWQVLEANLQQKHQAQPVHSLADISLLARRFPEHIGIHVVQQAQQVVAGVVSFKVGPVFHLQYIASSVAGQACSALDGLLDSLISQAHVLGFSYFDFGTSNEDQGRVLNEGLYHFKSQFGAGGVAYETYELGL